MEKLCQICHRVCEADNCTSLAVKSITIATCGPDGYDWEHIYYYCDTHCPSVEPFKENKDD